ncbi:MAG: tRNA pseudouridine(38-40) synthase TruA [Chloroflexi bacterium RBG_13_46_14]|nr:MAG: tRNA pseudouridine(38-40) synthase TruA [Chloroflexi bacterium RBG_13_46_14]
MVKQAETTKVVLIIEYEGTRYHGFQLQGKLPTIQRELETALFSLTGEKTRVITASRTDAGVHAEAQVVSFRTRSGYSTDTFINALNYYLPGDIAVKAACRVKDSFNVRRHAISREYNYYILNGKTRSPLRDRFCYLLTGQLNIEAMNEASQVLLGEHDFVSFVSNREAAEKSTVRRVERVEMRKEGDLVIFNIVANSFLMHQVRNTVGSLIRLGRGKISKEEFNNILEARQPGKAWPTAPAKGLCLLRVNYKNPIGEEI